MGQVAGQPPFVTFAPRFHNSYNHAHAPGQSAGQCPCSSSKQWKSDGRVKPEDNNKIYNFVSARSPLMKLEIQERKKNIERAAI